MLFRVIILFLLFSVCEIAFSQNPSYWNITDEDGLPSMTIYQMLQDETGLVWLATANGICSYDGYSFKSYYSSDQEDNDIMDIDLDSKNRIWYSNLSRQLFVIENDQAQEVKLSDLDDEIKVDDFEIVEDVLWYREEYANIRKVRLGWASLDEEIKNVKGEVFPNLFNFSLTKLTDTKDGIEFGIESSIYEIKNAKKTELNEILKTEKFVSVFNSLFKYKDQFYIHNQEFTTEENSISFQLDDNEKIVNYNYQFGSHSLHFLENEIWTLTSKGILVNSIGKENSGSRHIFERFYCNDLLQDLEENIWLSTDGNGIIIIPNRFVEVYEQASNSLPANDVNKLYLDEVDNRLFIGLSGGHIGILDQNLNYSQLDLPSKERNRDIIKDKDGNLVIVMNHDIHLYNPSLDKIASKKVGAVKSILKDVDGSLWVGAAYGNSKFEDWSQLSSIMESKERTYSFLQDMENKIWIGTTSGLFVRDEKNKVIKDEKTSSSFDVRSMVQTPDSIIWLGTQGRGVIKIKNRKVIGSITVEDGLSSNSCNKLLLDEGRIWVGTKNGLNSLNLKDGSIELINLTDGLPSNEINDLALFKGKLWVGTSKGLASFDKNRDFTNKFQPFISISKFKILESDTVMSTDMKLPYDQNHVQFEYLGVGFRSRKGLNYEYKLSGINQDWVKTKSRIARFPSLPFGKYSFEVRAENEDGIKSKEAAKYHFEITAAWWQTLWFKLLLGLIILGSFGLIIYLRFLGIRNREKREQEFKDKVVELKGQALQSQMNPHFIFNCLNSILNFLTKNDRQNAMMYLAKFAKLIRQIFYMSEKKSIYLEEEINFLESYIELEELRFGDKVTVNFLVDNNLKTQMGVIKIPPLLIQPIIENAFKHGLFHKKSKGQLDVNLRLESDVLHCTVKDNGVGRAYSQSVNKTKHFDESSKDSSNGLQVVEERLNMHNRLSSDKKIEEFIIDDLLDEQGIPLGTKVCLSIKTPN